MKTKKLKLISSKGEETTIQIKSIERIRWTIFNGVVDVIAKEENNSLVHIVWPIEKMYINDNKMRNFTSLL